MKSIEELHMDAEGVQILIGYYRADAASLRREALLSDAQAVMHQRELDDIERQLIAATGEAS
jgi:hypothetical protein